MNTDKNNFDLNFEKIFDKEFLKEVKARKDLKRSRQLKEKRVFAQKFSEELTKVLKDG